MGHSDSVFIVTLSLDGEFVASESDDTTIRLWDVATGQCHFPSMGRSGTIQTIAFSPDSQMLVSGSEDHTVGLWYAVLVTAEAAMKDKSLKGTFKRIFK